MALFDKFKSKKKDKVEVKTEIPQEENAEVIEDEIINENEQIENEPLINEEEQPVQVEEKAETKEKKGFFEKLKIGLSKTRANLSDKIVSLVKSNRQLDEDFWEELEEILIQADVGVNTSLELVENIRKRAKKEKITDSEQVMDLIKEEVSSLLSKYDSNINISAQPTVILVVGVNGAGKTTSIAKMAHRYKQENKKVLLAAGDTFRAAAIDQLQIWADRVGVELIKHQEGADPGAVVFDALNAAQARKSDVIIIDTAGRLQNKTNLMKEISKVRKIIEREIPEAPHEVLLVVDATTGQNAISQAKVFQEATSVTGIILTKLDGTAKGGIVISVAKELDIPVKLVGIGEGMEDLRDFSAKDFA
ncbi:MAG: signal recognition particle-docking protein FtsY, partial [Syntrophomonadaceae bacterium]|nr:signal recognition particle-docking protein FtsY [Syntrophomonadaceae bacterium]